MLIFECKSKNRVSLLLTEDSEGDFYEEGRLEHVEINAGVDRSGKNWVLTKDGFRTGNADGSLGPSPVFRFQQGTLFNSGFGGILKPNLIFK